MIVNTLERSPGCLNAERDSMGEGCQLMGVDRLRNQHQLKLRGFAAEILEQLAHRLVAWRFRQFGELHAYPRDFVDQGHY
jgi:hypothetical protein